MHTSYILVFPLFSLLCCAPTAHAVPAEMWDNLFFFDDDHCNYSKSIPYKMNTSNKGSGPVSSRPVLKSIYVQWRESCWTWKNQAGNPKWLGFTLGWSVWKCNGHQAPSKTRSWDWYEISWMMYFQQDMRSLIHTHIYIHTETLREAYLKMKCKTKHHIF